ncbi:MAG TPA: 4Fe-4S dicluster domain-containing protein [Chloroflexota bacterium]|nr:4Fe-4S dicluster domain-containing protein [Chloroflexota bacterium]
MSDDESVDIRTRRQALFSDALAQHADLVSRRRFLELMGASVALAGLSGACAPPREQIVPYVRPPEEVVPGKPLFFASAHVLGGYAQGVLVESHEGRPTKIEGNPQHPDSLGSTDAFGQASVLNLYDPNRSQAITFNGNISTWADFLRQLHTSLAARVASGGQGLRFLSETVTSPSLAAQMSQILQTYPRARWHRWEPLARDNSLAGAQLAFGQAVETRYHLDAADVVLSLDADLFAWAPGHVRYMHDFAARRRPEQRSLSRVYAVESAPSLLGAAADHRLPIASRAIEPFAFALTAALGIDVGAPQAQAPTGVPPGWLESVAADLRGHGHTALVVAGDSQPPTVHALAHSINAALGSVGTTVDYSAPVTVDPLDNTASLRQLTDDMNGGQVSLLLILSGNPAYTAPADIPFADALPRVALRVHLGLFDDETAQLCQWHLPEAHALETWTDARAFDGTASIVQPLIAPLYDGHSVHEVLAPFTDQPDAASHAVVRGYWQAQHNASDFDDFWRTSLHDGLVGGSALPASDVTVRPGWAADTIPTPAPVAGDLELVFRPDPAVLDGRFTNNGWLLEIPRPLTKLSWDNVALFSPATAQRLGLASKDVVELRSGGRSLRAPVWVLPGMAEDSVSVTLGYGRARGAGAGNGVGFNAYALRTSADPWFVGGLQVIGTGETAALASTQGHYSMEGRELVLSVTPEQLQTATAGGVPAVGQQQRRETLYPAYKYPDNAWGMVIDTSSCVGCNACIVACQAENNIPVVGKAEVARGREMQWLRVDTYFEGSDSNPTVVQQLVPCMHCENAPCELVCPVGATVHSSEGLNDMVYNRCVGTRYCSNNCPYKVRHFNFFEYSDFQTPSLKLQRNPDVTVRSRGVMEKCSYCVQRINAARIQAQTENRPIRDGEVLTACQAACPTNAIVFGNLNDPTSAVTRQRSLSRNFTLLAELNTRPRTTYLARVANPNPTLGTLP